MSQLECKACDGTGLLEDDEGWKYNCSVCSGSGEVDASDGTRSTRVMRVDANNRLLD